MRQTRARYRSDLRAWLPALVLIAAVVMAMIAAGCERNSDLVAEEQIRDSQNPCPNGCEEPIPGCVIKGKVSPTGEKRFVTPNNRFYRTLSIDPATGERWFCNETEAVSNGFSASRDN